MRKMAYVIIINATFLSCKHGVEFIIENRRDSTVKNILIANNDPDATISIDSITKGSIYRGFLSFKNNPKVDGSYSIKINNNKSVRDNFGISYYSNGTPLDEKIHLTIYNDSNVVK
jgi:hypothetical protein